MGVATLGTSDPAEVVTRGIGMGRALGAWLPALRGDPSGELGPSYRRGHRRGGH